MKVAKIALVWFVIALTSTMSHVVASPATQLQVGSGAGVLGDIITIPISISNNPGFSTFTFYLEYDTSRLSPVPQGVTNGTVWSGDFVTNINATHEGKNVVLIAGSSTSNRTGNGVIINVSFQIRSGATSGTAILNLVVGELLGLNSQYVQQPVAFGVSTSGSAIVVGSSLGTEDAVLQVGSGVGVPGDIITIPISISNNPGFSTFTFYLEYDTSRLSPVPQGVTNGTVWSGDFVANINATHEGKNVVLIAGSSTSNRTGNGIIVNVSFQIRSGAPSGTAILNLVVGELLGLNSQYVQQPVAFGVSTSGSAIAVGSSLGTDSVVLQVGSGAGVPGDIITIPISISNNPGFSTFTFYLEYDTSSLSPVPQGVTNGTVWSGDFVANINATHGDKSVVLVTGSSTSNRTGNGTIVNVSFQIRSSKPDGTASLNLVVGELLSLNDQHSQQPVAYFLIPGAISTVIPYPPGFENAYYLMLDGWVAEKIIYDFELSGYGYITIGGINSNWIFVKTSAPIFSCLVVVSKGGSYTHIQVERKGLP